MALDRGNKSGSIDSALRWVGDLDHPFYSDERQRFIWYEASAIGFQLLLLTQYIIGGVAMLIFGLDALLYTLIGIIPAVLTSFVVLTYTYRRGAPFFVQSCDFGRSRGRMALAAVLLWGAGLARVAFELPGNSGDSGFDSGLIVGAVGGALAAAGLGWWMKRKYDRAEAAGADIES